MYDKSYSWQFSALAIYGCETQYENATYISLNHSFCVRVKPLLVTSFGNTPASRYLLEYFLFTVLIVNCKGALILYVHGTQAVFYDLIATYLKL